MTKVPRSNNWGKPKLYNWLQEHPLVGMEKEWVVKKVLFFMNHVAEEGEKCNK